MHNFFLWYAKNQFILATQAVDESAGLVAITKILNRPYPEFSYHLIVTPQILKKINSRSFIVIVNTNKVRVKKGGRPLS
jgi:hypothetical protein